MRVSDLIGLEVRHSDGESLGVVTDVRCVQDGPLRGSMRAPRVTALLVSRHHTGSTLPWLIRLIVQRLHRHAVLIPWDAIAQHQGRIILHPHPSGITDLPE
jgi:sporulation protein YlmC with PRC-barrel domain